MNRLGAVREYCLREYFIASCSSVGDVILMTSALYGRMRIGRCIRGTFNIGCSNDVTALFDDRCSGRTSCNAVTTTLHNVRPEHLLSSNDVMTTLHDVRPEHLSSCNVVITALLNGRCSGRTSCNVSVRSLVDSRPCQRDFASYLEASYRCIPGIVRQFTCHLGIMLALRYGVPTEDNSTLRCGRHKESRNFSCNVS